MKKILLLSFCLFIIASSYAQDTLYRPKLQQEFGVNVLYATQLGENPTPINVLSPYILDYRLQRGVIHVRLGLGGSYSNQLFKEDGFADREIDIDYRTDARVGFGINNTFDEKGKVMIGYGLDGFYTMITDVVIEESGFDRVTTSEQTNAYGAGLNLSLRYEIIKNLTLSSEFSLYVRIQDQRNKLEFENFPNQNDVSTINLGTDIWMISPLNIFVSYRF